MPLATETMEVEREVAARQVLELVREFRALRTRKDPPPSIEDQERLKRARALLDEIQLLCLRYLRRHPVRTHRHWVANLLLEAVYERNRLGIGRE